MIELKNLSKSYNRGQIQAVSDLDLAVKGGEIFGFLGPNGAGKTTTIKMMVGLLKPDAGQVKIKGFDIQKNPLAVKKRIGYVPDQPDVYEKLTGLEYLDFMADAYGVPLEDRLEKMEKLLEKFQMENAVFDLIQSYSHGMRQKIVLIGSLIPDPEVLIIDEPLTGLDPKSSHIFKEMMRSRCKEGKIVFFSTHILEVAEKFCDRVGIINMGRLIALGTLQELQKQAQRKESLESIFLELTAS